ncbi:hypothetical protein Dimus_019579 [Dionaea muscipula]
MGWIDEEAVPAVKNKSRAIKVAIKRWCSPSGRGYAYGEWQTEDQAMFLVYEYMENGSLDDYLFNKKKSHYKEPLNWDIRISIALGAARGIAFLHTLDKP